jgi:hypothetical protein
LPATSSEASPVPQPAVLAAEAIAEQGGLCSQPVAPTADPSEQAAGQGDQLRKGCPPRIKSCPASQVGQRCDPNNPALLCSAQANGAFCCLAYAGSSAQAPVPEPAEILASSGGGGPCCTHQDKTACQTSCQAAGCSNSFAACINLRCSCRCSGCP